ncbi:class I SAM-dependent methyltransferase [Luminiphilus sp. nBUS_16]|uniref:class I SAM-dependent methyltransferase n=1 Tax=Luminiphilus sp. nBUS_16 TaxID=3395315 RepID=UPI003EBCA3CC
MSNSLDEHAAAYQGDSIFDFDNEILLNWYSERILGLVDNARSMLELGLGHGHSAQKFAGCFERHVVLEGSEAVIRQFRDQYPDCKAEITQTWFEEFETDERFDLIVIGFVLEHVEEPRLILEHFKRFLAPRGRVFVAVPNAEVMNRRLGSLAGMLDDVTTLSNNDVLLGHKRFYTSDTFRAELVDAGFKVERMEGIYLKPFTTAQMLSLNLDPTIVGALCTMGIEYPELSCGLLAEITLQ